MHNVFESRYNFVKKVVDIAVKISGFAGRGRKNAIQIKVSHYDWNFTNMPTEFDGFVILHLSDLHLDGPIDITSVLSKILGTIDSDMCVMTGDFSYAHDESTDYLRRLMKDLCSAIGTDEIYGILGNHDRYDYIDLLSNLGIRMLFNEYVHVNRGDAQIKLIGIDDYRFLKFGNQVQLMDELENDEFTILLAHSPELIEQARKSEVDFYLCGHTHAGQIRLPFLPPWTYNINTERKYGSGRWNNGNLQGFTSPGVGVSTVPYRFNTVPEIAVHRLWGC
ncbi:MAG: metallophosphoesterase [Planctomycetes bacterium]|nr:metallophosphoesterase [Planctomycetota bacterium]